MDTRSPAPGTPWGSRASAGAKAGSADSDMGCWLDGLAAGGDVTRRRPHLPHPAGLSGKVGALGEATECF